MLLKQFPQPIPNKFAHQTAPQSLPFPTCGAPLRFEINTTLGCNFEIQEGDSTNSIIAARLPDLLQSKTQRPRNKKTRAVRNFRCKKVPPEKSRETFPVAKNNAPPPTTTTTRNSVWPPPRPSNSNHQDYYMHK